MSKQLKGFSLAFLGAFLFGGEIIALKIGLDIAEPMLIVWLQYLLGSVILFFYSNAIKSFDLKLIKANFLPMSGSAMLQILYVLLFSYAVDNLLADVATIFDPLGDILVIVGGMIFLNERMVKWQKLGLALSLIGLATFYSASISYLDTSTLNKGLLLILIAEFAWAGYCLAQKKLTDKVPPCVLNMFTFFIASIIMLPFVDLNSLTTLNQTAWLVVGLMTIINVFAFSFFIKSYQYIEASKVSLIMILSPIITLGMMYALLSLDQDLLELEPLTLRHIMGGILLLVGSGLASWTYESKSENFDKS
ncbi:DMT family transporter [Aureibacter tunicatorum]|uniref:Drug/metabolite transporter (DMT)-like permease n=1 Tax=Aureibacter tunicatorum TaxID=866807 RepID=A0AAE3XN87_9BACT|nr:DMT family transporter [Aureibacter tunicatorum]MDR6241041.1 drug/metabolite transporter (DMT)-like permease [Aureibacter tunicatorum]BDD03819.1 hypothetical protein AUTU_13020 [Aureibacter tunicatorum]